MYKGEQRTSQSTFNISFYFPKGVNISMILYKEAADLGHDLISTELHYCHTNSITSCMFVMLCVKTKLQFIETYRFSTNGCIIHIQD